MQAYATPFAGGSLPVLTNAPAGGCRRGLCVAGILVLGLIAIWFFSAPSRRRSGALEADSCYGAALQGADVAGAGYAARPAADSLAQKAAAAASAQAVQASSRPFNEPQGSLPAADAALTASTGKCTNPQAPEPLTSTAGVRNNTEMPSVSGSIPKAPRVSGAMVGAAISGSQLDAATYGLSEDSAEYYKHFKPVSLESTMPLGWRTAENPGKCSAGEDDLYSEFSRYAISPNQMKRAENMRSVLRLSEISRDGLSRTLGQRSLLRDFVTPLGPNPIGDNAMLWNDSSVRQNYIASATGRFPTVAENC